MAVLLGFSSCSEDKDPVYKAPTQFVLNTPVFQDQYYELAPGQTFTLVASQPDYGYSAITQYSAEVSLTENFENYIALPSTGTGTLAKMTFNDADLATALCELHGFDSEDNYQDLPAERVYFRAVAQLKGVEGSEIKSNVVYLDKVKFYFAVAVPGYIYLVGSPEGWVDPTEDNAEHYAPWRLFEASNAIGSKIYSGVFNIPEAPVFRFYTALTGWDSDSWGSQADDNPIEYEIVDGSFTTGLVKGKGSFSFPAWTGGEMTIIVDMSVENNCTLTIMAGSQSVVTPKYVYMVGNNAGWAEPNQDNAATYDAWRLVDKTDSGIYTATFDIEEGSLDGGNTLYCRFYQELNGWGAAQWSASADGSNVATAFGEPKPTVEGEGCFEVADAGGKKVTVTLNTTTSPATVTFTAE